MTLQSPIETLEEWEMETLEGKDLKKLFDDLAKATLESGLELKKIFDILKAKILRLEASLLYKYENEFPDYPSKEKDRENSLNNQYVFTYLKKLFQALFNAKFTLQLKVEQMRILLEGRILTLEDKLLCKKNTKAHPNLTKGK